MKSTKILVAVDGSDWALRALEFAGKRASVLEAAILVLNVQPGIPSSRLVSRAMIAEHQARQARAALKGARALIRRLGIEAAVHVRIGDPAATIADFAKKHRCEEIVIGSRGLGKVAGLLLGSVAVKVIHLAPCPVTVVK